MSEGAVYDGYVEIYDDGTCLAQLLDLPGCYGRGASQQIALSALAASIPGYYAWLRRHDEYTPEVAGPFSVAVRDIISAARTGNRRSIAFFPSDREPVTTEDLDWGVALLDWAFADLFELARAIPPQAMERSGPAGPTPRSVLEYALQMQLWYISRLESQPNVPRIEYLPGSTLDRLQQIWQASVARFRATTDEERGRILEHEGEVWTLRKILRRSTLHIREHTDILTHTLAGA